MTVFSYPFDAGAGATVSEAQFSRFFRELGAGVADSLNGAGFAVSAIAGQMQVQVNAGFAIVRGHACHNDAALTLTVGAATTQTRFDRVVLRMDPSANTITPTVLAGTPGAGSPPALTETESGLFDLPLAILEIAPSATSLSGAITDDRRFTGTRVGIWRTSSQRPNPPRYGQLGYNQQLTRWEWWDTTQWVALVPPAGISSVDWNDITGKPSTFAPSFHGHSYLEITDLNPSTVTGVGSAALNFTSASSQADIALGYDCELRVEVTTSAALDGSTDTTLFNLSSGYRPRKQIEFLGNTSGGATWGGYIMTGGQCRIASSFEPIASGKVLQFTARYFLA